MFGRHHVQQNTGLIRDLPVIKPGRRQRLLFTTAIVCFHSNLDRLYPAGDVSFLAENEGAVSHGEVVSSLSSPADHRSSLPCVPVAVTPRTIPQRPHHVHSSPHSTSLLPNSGHAVTRDALTGTHSCFQRQPILAVVPSVFPLVIIQFHLALRTQRQPTSATATTSSSSTSVSSVSLLSAHLKST